MSDELRLKFPDLTPAAQPPALAHLHGIGLLLYGRRDHDAETRSFVKTRCLCLVYLPILALDSWRVLNAQGGGWMLLGRCPISPLARAWNMLVLASLLVGAGAAGWNAYTSSPDYQAGRRLEAGRKAAHDGHLMEAARGFLQVAQGGTAHAPAAATALAALASRPLDHETAGVQTAFVGLLAGLPDGIRVSGSMAPEVAALAEGLAAAAAPRDAIAIIEAAAPVLAKDRLAAARHGFLLAANAKDPGDPWPACELALIAEQAGDKERCRILLEPCAGRLGDAEGARILGGIYAAAGRIEDSHRLLRPYVLARLKELQAAAEAFEAAQEAASKAAYDGLNNGVADKAWYDRFALADKSGKQAMVQEWIGKRLAGDPAIAAAEKRLSAVAPTVPVALDLGIVTIQRAQGIVDPGLRKQELEEAERIFLAIRGMAGESDAYRLWMAQVDYWLGKPAEGRRLLDELLTARKREAKVLRAASEVLREVGDDGAARTLAEEAYSGSTTDLDRFEAAIHRSLLAIDIDDKIAWLERGDPASPSVIAELPAARGTRAHRDGRDDEAVAELSRSLAAWSAMPRSGSSLNNSATVAQELYQITGDPAHLRISCERLEEAYKLMPSHTILFSNLLSSRLRLAWATCVGTTIDAAALGRAIGADELAHCYRDSAGRTEVIGRYLSAASHRDLLADAERLLLMSPRSASTYDLLRDELLLVRDARGLAALDARAAKVDLDDASAWDLLRDFLAGKRDAQLATEAKAACERLSRRVEALRGAGKDATRALALDLLVGQRLGGVLWGQEADLDACVAQADEAQRLHPCHATSSILGTALAMRAARRLAATDPALAALIAAHRRLLHPGLVLLCRASAGGPDPRLAGDPDLQRAAALVGERLLILPEKIDLWDWTLLQAVGDPAAGKAAQLLQSDAMLTAQVSLDLKLNPTSAVLLLQAVLFHRLNGDAGKAGALIAAARARGLPLGDGL